MKIKTLFPANGLQVVMIYVNDSIPQVALVPAYSAAICTEYYGDKTTEDSVEGIISSEFGLLPARSVPGFFAYVYTEEDAISLTNQATGHIQNFLLSDVMEGETDESS